MGEIYTYQTKGLWFHHKRDQRPDGKSFTAHTHEIMEVYYFVSGAVRFYVEGSVYPLAPGDVLIMRPAETHALSFDDSAPYERITFHFSADYFDRYFPGGRALLDPFFKRELGTKNRLEGGDFRSPVLKDCMEAVSSRAAAGGEEVYIRSMLLPVLAEVGWAFRNRGQGPDGAKEDPLTVELIRYINRHLFEPLSVARISEDFYLSPSQLNRTFRAATGSTIWHYILEKRLVAAHEKIRAGESAQAACFACGFNEYSAFYRAYKAKFAVSPREDRQSP